MIGNIGRGLFGGLLDGKPGAFSQHEGGLRGLLGSFNDGQQGNALFGQSNAPAADPWSSMVAMGQQQAVPQSARPMKEPSFGDGLKRALFPSTYAAMDQMREKQRAAGQREAVMNALRGSMGENGFDSTAFLRGLAEAGVDLGVNDVVALDKAGRPDYSFHTAGGGDIVRTDSRSGAAETVFDYTDPNSDLERQLLLAQIEAAKALGNQRGAAAQLSSVRADAGGFAPRGGGRGSGGGAPWNRNWGG